MTEKEFISGMWQKAEAMSRTEEEVQRARLVSNELRRKERIQLIAVILTIAAVIVMATLASTAYSEALQVSEAVMLVTMVAAFYLDSRQYTAIQNENGGSITYG